jgi:EAL domain-containing protein (putative c-di-GMP-specific phosphodiesterase class I)
MSEEVVKTLTKIAAPYGREVVLESVEHESNLRMLMLRIRIREGSRFTIMDIDADTAERWSTVMSAWASKSPQ